MAKLVNYNGFVAPFDPEMEYYNKEEYSKSWNGYHYIFKVYGEYYLFVTGFTSGRQARVDYTVTPNMLHMAYIRDQYRLNSNGRWEEINIFTPNVHLFPIDDVEVIYADQALFYLKLGDSGIWPNEYCEQSPEAYVVTEYPILPIVSSYGWNKLEDSLSDPPKTSSCYIPHISTPQEKLWLLKIWNNCSASTTDEGTITIEWYRNNRLYSTISGKESIVSQFKPPVREIGISTWYAIVTNTKDGLNRVKRLNNFTISIIDWNLERNQPMDKTSNQKIEQNSYEKISPNEIIKEGLQDFSLIMNSFSKNNQEQVILFLKENGDLHPLTTLLKIKGLRGD